MIGRRSLCTGAAAAALGARLARAALPPGGSLMFDVRRNGSRIGTHALSFRTEGDRLTVSIEARFSVGLGPITLYRYHHTGTECWESGRFVSLDTQTNDDGKHRVVRARRTRQGTLIQATDLADRTEAAEVLPLTHWAIAAMRAPVFNPETGEMLPVQARPLGPGTVPLADGAKVRAEGFQFDGRTPITDWFTPEQRWTALDATAKDGSRITYRLA